MGDIMKTKIEILKKKLLQINKLENIGGISLKQRSRGYPRTKGHSK